MKSLKLRKLAPDLQAQQCSPMKDAYMENKKA